MKTKKSWEPILVGAAAQKAWKIIEQLDSDCWTLEKTLSKSPTLFQLMSGLQASLFCRYLYASTGERKLKKRAQSLLQLSAESLFKNSPNDRLFSGFTGIGWFIEHFRHLDKTRWTRKTDPNIEIDSFLISKIRKSISSKEPLKDFGLCDAWVGYGVYALERQPHANSKVIVENLVKLLKNNVKRSEDGAAWYSLKSTIPAWDRPNYRSGYFNLGLAHGNPGVLVFLTKAYMLTMDEGVRDLLLESVRWLLSQDDGKPYGYFVPLSSLKKKRERTGRLAWCYGDLGISVALFQAAEALEDSHLKDRAFKIATRAAQIPKTKHRVMDSTLCHGALGAFHIFNRIYHNTGQNEFKRWAQKWAAGGFDFVKREQSKPKDEVYPFNEYDLITGRCGIGLSLLAGVSKVEPTWDRLLLIS